jgi:hypothetical protein
LTKGYIDYGSTRRERIFIPQHLSTGVIGMDTLRTRYALWERKHADPLVKIRAVSQEVKELIETVEQQTLSTRRSSTVANFQPTAAEAESRESSSTRVQQQGDDEESMTATVQKVLDDDLIKLD